ncbi:MAG: heme exporter protein CcmD [Roseiarcus sp.]|jgi:heme exporter protein CcmD
MMAAPHIGFVVAGYAIAALVVAAMIASILWDYRALSAALRRLEKARGDKDPPKDAP